MDTVANEPFFQVHVEMTDGACRIRGIGELDIAAAPTLLRALEEAQQSAAARVLLDLSGVTFMDSSGIHALTTATAASRSGADKLRIVRDYQPQVERILTLTHVIAVLPHLTD